jgi:hypothetical protein
MKLIASFTVGMLALVFLQAAPPNKTVRAFFFEVPPGVDLPVTGSPRELASLAAQKGVSSAVTERVPITIGQRLTLESMRKVNFPDQRTPIEIGVRFLVVPLVEGDRVDFSADFEIAEIAALPDSATQVRKITSINGLRASTEGDVCRIPLPTTIDRQRIQEDDKPEETRYTERRRVAFLVVE